MRSIAAVRGLDDGRDVRYDRADDEVNAGEVGGGTAGMGAEAAGDDWTEAMTATGRWPRGAE